jgi:hypothetical protein
VKHTSRSYRRTLPAVLLSLTLIGAGGTTAASAAVSPAAAAVASGAAVHASVPLAPKQPSAPKPAAPKPVTRNANAPSADGGSSSGTTTGRNVRTPQNITGSNPAATGRSVRVPQNIGGSVPAGSRSVNIKPPAKVVKPAPALKSGGKVYEAPNGKRYTYKKDTYRSYRDTYRGGYPDVTSALFTLMIMDAFYAPNYTNPDSQFYQADYPAGYELDDGMLVKKGTNWGKVLLWTGIVLLVIIGLVVTLAALGRRRASEPFGAGV